MLGCCLLSLWVVCWLLLLFVGWCSLFVGHSCLLFDVCGRSALFVVGWLFVAVSCCGCSLRVLGVCSMMVLVGCSLCDGWYRVMCVR